MKQDACSHLRTTTGWMINPAQLFLSRSETLGGVWAFSRVCGVFSLEKRLWRRLLSKESLYVSQALNVAADPALLWMCGLVDSDTQKELDVLFRSHSVSVRRWRDAHSHETTCYDSHVKHGGCGWSVWRYWLTHTRSWALDVCISPWECGWGLCGKTQKRAVARVFRMVDCQLLRCC